MQSFWILARYMFFYRIVFKFGTHCADIKTGGLELLPLNLSLFQQQINSCQAFIMLLLHAIPSIWKEEWDFISA